MDAGRRWTKTVDNAPSSLAHTNAMAQAVVGTANVYTPAAAGMTVRHSPSSRRYAAQVALTFSPGVDVNAGARAVTVIPVPLLMASGRFASGAPESDRIPRSVS